MAIFGDISKKISTTSQNVVQKAKGMADVTGLKSQISEEHKKIESYYQSLGKVYYDLKHDNPEPELQELVALIKDSYHKIDEINATITSIENAKTCSVCGTPIEDDMIFCVGCGTKIERQKSPDENKKVPDMKFCINCGNKIPWAAAFCTQCGAKQG